jgi:hypothetical protein
MKCGNASPIRLTAYQRGFLQVWSFYQIATVEHPFYLNRRKRVNTILTHFLRLRATRKSDVGKSLRSAMRRLARAVMRSRSGTGAHHLSPIVKNVALVKTATAEAAVLGEAEQTDELSE